MVSRDRHFTHRSAAERYAQDRPNIHPLVMEHIRQVTPLAWPIARALDIACGTGQSTRALTSLAQRVIGTDLSTEMLRVVQPDPATTYCAATAEALPFPSGTFELATVALAFHWFDRAVFLREVWRVLSPDGWLIIYDNGFRGTMTELTHFASWFRESYLQRFPSPPRQTTPLTREDAARAGFALVRQDHYANELLFSPTRLARYLMTQSNVIAAVEGGREELGEVQDWLVGALTPLLPAGQGTFQFGGAILYLRRLDTR